MEKKEEQINKLVAEYEKSLYGQYLEDQLPLISKGYYDALRKYHYSNESVEGLREKLHKIIEDKLSKYSEEAKGYMAVLPLLYMGEFRHELINEIIPHLQKQQESDAWISVESDYPKTGQKVLFFNINEISDKEEIRFGGKYEDNTWWAVDAYEDETFNVTHWKQVNNPIQIKQ